MTELILAFDAGCAVCRALASSVAGAGLDVLPLGDYRVVAWCAEAGVPGDGPTLIEVRPTPGADRVRAWTGLRLGPALARRVGARRTATVLRALRTHGLLGAALRGTVGSGAGGVRRPSPGRGA